MFSAIRFHSFLLFLARFAKVLHERGISNYRRLFQDAAHVCLWAGRVTNYKPGSGPGLAKCEPQESARPQCLLRPDALAQGVKIFRYTSRFPLRYFATAARNS